MRRTEEQPLNRLRRRAKHGMAALPSSTLRERLSLVIPVGDGRVGRVGRAGEEKCVGQACDGRGGARYGLRLGRRSSATAYAFARGHDGLAMAGQKGLPRSKQRPRCLCSLEPVVLRPSTVDRGKQSRGEHLHAL